MRHGHVKEGGITTGVHVGVDEGSGLHTEGGVDAGQHKRHGGGTEMAVYADRAYDTHERRQRLKSMGIGDRIQASS